MKNILTTICAIMLLFVQSNGQQAYQPPSDAAEALKSVTPQSLLSHVRFLSHDLLEGRAPGTRGDLLTQNYIATQMQLLGLQPGGEKGSYTQRVPIVAMKTDKSVTLNLSANGSIAQLNFGPDFIIFPGNQETEVSVKDAEIVFVGYGIVAPEQQWDDYKDVDVSGKILLMMNNDPSTDDKAFFGGKARTYYGRWTYKYEIAAKKGAAGAIVIHTTESAGYGWNVVESSWSGERFELSQKPGIPRLAFKAWTSQDATQKIMTMAGKNLAQLVADAETREFKPVPLGVKLFTTLKTSKRNVETANVLGVLPGSDPSLKEEAIIFTAHHDHFGIGKPIDGDSIYNGALDNATGTSAVLGLARMYSALPRAPKRTMIFATVAAEEYGLIGSQYYAENPTVPPARLAANINIDGLNIFGRTKDIIMVGLGKSSIDNTLKSVAAWQGREVKPDQFPEQGSFYRSDQFNFAKIGVPCMYLDAGIEYIGKPADFGKKKVDEYISKNYHQPSDEVEADWELSGAVEDLQLMFLVGLTLANNPEMPAWNKGDEFEGIRLQALQKKK